MTKGTSNESCTQRFGSYLNPNATSGDDTSAKSLMKRESLISTTYFSLLGKRARLFTKSRKGTTLHLKNGRLYLVLGFMMHCSLDKWNLVFCAAVKKHTYWILDYSFRCLMYTLLRKSYFVVFTNFKTATLCILH